jgi:hypothetical protein
VHCTVLEDEGASSSASASPPTAKVPCTTAFGACSGACSGLRNTALFLSILFANDHLTETGSGRTQVKVQQLPPFPFSATHPAAPALSSSLTANGPEWRRLGGRTVSSTSALPQRSRVVAASMEGSGR